MKKWFGEGLIYVCMLICVYLSASPLEMIATITGLLCVWLTTKENIWCWPIGLINVGCFFLMFYEAKLYADMTLQVIFFILSIQGWVIWMTNRQNADVRPTKKISSSMTVVLSVLLIVVTIAWGYVLEHFTDASIPYLDAFIATLSIIAQYLLSNKILENWYVWITVDALSVGMYLYKGLYSVALLYTVFLVIAILGMMSWKRTYLFAKGNS